MRWLGLLVLFAACGDHVVPSDPDATTPPGANVLVRFEVPDGASVSFELDSLRLRGDTAERVERDLGFVVAGESPLPLRGLAPGLYSELELTGRALVARRADGTELRRESWEWMARCDEPFELGVEGDVEVVLALEPDELDEAELGLDCGELESDETARESRRR